MRKTHSLLDVATVMVANPGQHWGYELSRASGVPSGVLYPILRRMLNEGWLESWLEDGRVGPAQKRPRRRYYQLTDAGKTGVAKLILDRATGKEVGR